MDQIKISSDGKLPDVQVESKKQRDLKKACKDFEAVFTYQLLKSMRRTVQKCELFHGGQGEEIYESMFDMELSKRMAGSGRNSLSELLYDQLSERLGAEEKKTEDRDQMSEVGKDKNQRSRGVSRQVL